MRRWRWLGTPWLAGALLRGLVALLPVVPRWDGVLYLRAAEQLAAGEGYTLRMLRLSAEPLPTAFYPVGYPAFLAALIGLGLSGAALRVAQALIASLAIVGAALLGQRLAGRRAGVAAAWLMAVHPGLVLLSASYLAEPVFAALLALVLGLAVHRRRALAWTGLPLGVLALVRPLAAPIAVIVGALDGLRAQRARGLVIGAALSSALVLVALSPWMLRNQRALGSPVPIATNGGFNLLVGTVGIGAYGELPEGLDCTYADVERVPAAHFEAAKDRCRSRRALERIATDPLGALGRAAVKLGNTFGHESSPARYLAAALGSSEDHPLAIAGSVACTLFLYALYALAFRGRARHLSPRTRLGLLGALLATTLMHGLVLGGDRYHLAIVPCLCALAGAGVTASSRSTR